MTEPTTIRQHLQAIIALHPGYHGLTYKHTMAALDLLDNADRFDHGFPDMPSEDDVLIYDPAPKGE